MYGAFPSMKGSSSDKEHQLDEIMQWTIAAARAAAAKKGEETLILDVGAILSITDAFVITSAPNTRLVRTIVEEVEKAVKADGGPAPLRIEGLSAGEWALLDYGDFVVHVFLTDVRHYYDLERLWADVPRIEWEDSRPRAAAVRQ